MTIQFPLGPSVGDTFPYDDYIYTWDGEKWTVLAPGDTYWEKDDNGYLNADTSVIIDGDLSVSGDSTVSGDITVDGDATVGSLNGGQLAGFRNKIINGGMAVDQRYDGTLTTVSSTNSFILDRWRGIGGNEGGNNSMQLGRVDTPLPADDRHLRYAMEISHVNGASFSGTVGCITSIEDGFRSQVELTLSIRCTEAPTRAYVYYSNDAFTTGVPQYDGLLTDLSGADDANGYRSYGVTFITSNNTTINNACYIRFEWSGGTPRYMTGVQLEPGPVATPFEHRPIGTELALCQRYFYKWTYPGRDAVYVMQRDSSNAARSQTLSVPVPMRVLPSSEFYQWEKFSVINNQSNAVTWTSGKGIAGGARGIPFVNFAFYLTIDTLNGVTWGAWTVNYIRSNHNDADNMPYILLDAEL